MVASEKSIGFSAKTFKLFYNKELEISRPRRDIVEASHRCEHKLRKLRENYGTVINIMNYFAVSMVMDIRTAPSPFEALARLRTKNWDWSHLFIPIAEKQSS